jgi:hypothetical protein
MNKEMCKCFSEKRPHFVEIPKSEECYIFNCDICGNSYGTRYGWYEIYLMFIN